MTTVTERRSSQSVDVPAPVRRVREVAVFHNRFGTLFHDDVIAPSGAAGQSVIGRASSPFRSARLGTPSCPPTVTPSSPTLAALALVQSRHPTQSAGHPAAVAV